MTFSRHHLDLIAAITFAGPHDATNQRHERTLPRRADVMDQPFNLVIVAIAVVCAWLALRPHYVFLIAIDHGNAHVSKGKVAREFISEVTEVCDREHIARGWIGGIARGKRMKLAFSRTIPAPCQQQLRNLWAMHR